MEFCDLETALKNHCMKNIFDDIVDEENKLKKLKYAASILEACDTLFVDIEQHQGNKILIDFYKIAVGFDSKGNEKWQDVLRYDIKDSNNQKIVRNSHKLHQLLPQYVSYDVYRQQLGITHKMPLEYVISATLHETVLKDLLGEELYQLHLNNTRHHSVHLK
jgi:uncharacterized protein YfbU (UPF0304 family)